MKKTLLAMAIAGVALMGMTNAARAADGTINFSGEILDQTCAISATSSTMNVDLGKVSKSSLTGAAGTKSAPQPFEINLTSCPAALANATVKFDGTADATNSDLLKITSGTGVATGVGIEISDVNGVVPLHSASMSYPLAAGGTKLQFTARYVSTSAVVGNGTANGVSQFTLNYK
ncbi:fimbrial protein [Dryocola clanedunensis]|uniref:fimbrial protein n=1 Tax=Cedecea sulfonylureivorans TaxID=3051154 RepID=UPI0019260559|nr:fimbrial protein [Cedecea sulfonylureivorans]